MDALLSQFSFLTDESLRDKNFKPKRVEDLMLAFEKEAMASWAAMEYEADEMEKEAEASMRDFEAYLDGLMVDSMRELESLNRLQGSAMTELGSLVQGAEAAKRMGKYIVGAATAASNKYVDAATATVKSAWAGVSRPRAKPKAGVRVHPN